MGGPVAGLDEQIASETIPIESHQCVAVWLGQGSQGTVRVNLLGNAQGAPQKNF